MTNKDVFKIILTTLIRTLIFVLSVATFYITIALANEIIPFSAKAIISIVAIGYAILTYINEYRDRELSIELSNELFDMYEQSELEDDEEDEED